MPALRRLASAARRALLTACADCVAADGYVRPPEAELLRVVAAVLEVPMPPLATGQCSVTGH